MATLNIGGQKVTVDDSFMSLPPEQQSATVEEIHASMGAAKQAPQAPAAAEPSPSIPRAIADVPSESYNATANALSSIGSNLNPFSDARRKAYENKDLPLGSMLSTGQGLMGVIGAPFAPIQGALRSLVGHPLDTADSMLRAGATKIHGDENVAPPIGYEGAKNAVDTALMGVSPRGASPIAVTPRAAPPAPPMLEANTAAQNIGVDLPRAIGTDSQFTGSWGRLPTRCRAAARCRGVGSGADADRRGGGECCREGGRNGRPDGRRARIQHGIETSFKPTIKARVSASL
jgi:hypothetical protein